MAAPDTQFRKVLDRFIRSLSKDEVEDFQFSKLEDIHKVIGELQEEQGKRKKMMNLTRIASFLEAMEQFGRVIEIFLNSTKFLAFIWTSSAWVESFDKLLDAYQQIGETIPLLIQYEGLFRDKAYMQRVLELIYFDILEFHRRALKFFKQRAWRQLFRSCWKDFMAHFQSILENLRRHKNLVESQATLAHFEATQVARTAAENNILYVEKAMIRQQLVSVRDWLCSAKVFNDQHHYAGVRSQHAEFGQWLLKHRRMTAWLDPTSNSIPLLWLHGIPGAGKTILTSLIVEKVQQIPDAQIAFFYCKNGDALRSTFIAIAKSILNQLLCQNKNMLSYIYERSSVSGESSLETSTLAKDLLETLIKGAGSIFMIIDGLDECPQDEKRTTISWFKSVIDTTNESDPGRLRCLFVSQDDGGIRKLFVSVPEIKITSEVNMEDIHHYASCKAIDLQNKFGISVTARQDICHKVCNRANGMFLFAKLVMTNLLNQTSRARMCDEVHPDRFPCGLEQAYARIVESIFVDAARPEREAAESLLGWLICAKRPLRWHEIQGAISIDTINKVVDFDNRQLCVNSKDLCGSLVEVHPDDSVELVHLTARFYLTDQNYISIAKENFRLTSLCLEYLALECFDIHLSNQSIRDYIWKGWYAFYDYAVLHWVDHLDSCTSTLDDTDSNLLDQLEETIRNFLRSRWPRNIPHEIEKLKDANRKFSRFNKTDFFDRLLQAVTEICNRQTVGFYETHVEKDDPYLVTQLESVRYNLEEEAKCLTPRSTKLDRYRTFYGENYFKCGQMSCQYFYKGFGSSQERNQHFSKHGRPFNCPFIGCLIASTGYSTARELAKHMSGFHPTGHEGLNIFPSRKLTGINQAIKTGNLYEVGYYLDEKPYEKYSAGKKQVFIRKYLMAAVKLGHDAVLQIILKWGDFPRDIVLRALRAAARFDQISTMQIKVLLHIAPLGRENATKFVIERCKNLLQKDSKGHTAIFIASDHGHMPIVKQLLESGMDCGLSLEKPDNTSLAIAARSGYEEIVQILLKNNDVRVESDKIYWLGVCQLFNGAQEGDENVVRQLLDRSDVPPNIRSRSGYTPLMIASKGGHKSVVELLLARKAVDPNFRARWSGQYLGPSALGISARHGHESVVKLLLERSDTILAYKENHGSYPYQTPAQVASKYHHDSIATLINQRIEKSQPTEPQIDNLPDLPKPEFENLFETKYTGEFVADTFDFDAELSDTFDLEDFLQLSP